MAGHPPRVADAKRNSATLALPGDAVLRLRGAPGDFPTAPLPRPAYAAYSAAWRRFATARVRHNPEADYG